MQTQSISSLVQTGFGAGAASKSAKANSAGFDSFMSSHAQSAGQNKAAEAVPATSKKPSESDYVKLTDQPVKASELSKGSGNDTVSRQPVSEQPAALDGDNGGAVVEEIRTDEFEEKMVAVLSQFFSMSEQEILDILEQGGIDAAMLLFQIQPDNSVSLINQGALSQLIMDVHGIEDKSVFLTSDLLNRELTQLTDLVKELGAELFETMPEDLSKVEQSLLQSFAEYLAAGEGKGAGENIRQSQAMPVQEQAVSVADTEADAPSVIVEAYVDFEQTTTQSEAGQTGQGETQMDFSAQESAPQTDSKENDVAASGLFAEKISEAWKPDNEAVSSPEGVMRQIVEQIVRQVKIRVLPETTRMELQLNPASLGRVSLQVSHSGGVSTAVMAVENQIAKEALESQMITLKQSFEEQGLKVSSVEVTVSEFGLDQGQENTGERQNESAGKRNFREDAGKEAMEESFENLAQTEESRRDSNSVVDYTA